jgi:adenylylsulfate kinase-like enzyme
MVIWIIGLAGSGKSTIGHELFAHLKAANNATVMLDGDIFREVMGDNLGHDIEARRVNGWRLARLCAFFDRQRIDVVCCVLSVFPDHREWCRQNCSGFLEVFVNVSMPELIRRDQKGLYSGALRGDVKNVVGVDLPFPPPVADIVIENNSPRTDFSEVISELLVKIGSLRKAD